MKYSLLPYTHELIIDWEKHKFIDPLIWDYLLFEEMIEEKKHIEWILFMAPSFKKMNLQTFALKTQDILVWIIKLISTSNNKGSPNKEDWFFPAAIDLLCERYWQLPNVLMTNMRMHQMKASFKWREWNINLQNNKPDANRWIIQEQEDQEDLLAQVKAMRLK